MKRIVLAFFIGALSLVGGCFSQHSVHMEPIRLEPIQVTMDVNVRVQNDSAGDEMDVEAADEADDGGPPTADTPEAPASPP